MCRAEDHCLQPYHKSKNAALQFCGTYIQKTRATTISSRPHIHLSTLSPQSTHKYLSSRCRLDVDTECATRELCHHRSYPMRGTVSLPKLIPTITVVSHPIITGRHSTSKHRTQSMTTKFTATSKSTNSLAGSSFKTTKLYLSAPQATPLSKPTLSTKATIAKDVGGDVSFYPAKSGTSNLVQFTPLNGSGPLLFTFGSTTSFAVSFPDDEAFVYSSNGSIITYFSQAVSAKSHSCAFPLVTDWLVANKARASKSQLSFSTSAAILPL